MADTSVGEVVAQFRTVLGLIDETAVTAKRAQEQAQKAFTAYTEASRGTSDRLMRTAVVDSRTAGEKAGKTARLLSEAAEHFTAYINAIAPGTLPPRSSAPEADASGDRILATTAGQGALSSKLLGRTASVPNADDGLQHAKKIATAIKDATGSGGVAVPKSPQPAIRAAKTQDASAGDALLAAFTVALLGIKGAEVAARLRSKARTKSAERTERKGDHSG
ncbi:hypothetical protein [Plantactinospora sp. BB1]|uniref:hypothetical protein n=1 Tax=Plantactinospora sp. BB1 TaxID=2071627 RepID=UPI000D177A46|nr:hypothetical protein [Plantactinospora sp. BB1]AVT37280.1 hypothetical protein C6W10_13315 [Plantactinospora sp. BB1]